MIDRGLPCLAMRNCAVGPCQRPAVDGGVFCPQHGPKPAAKRDGKVTNGVCPKCGGSQFTARRSNTHRVVGAATIGIGTLLTPRRQVQCVTCGAKYKRA